MGRRRAGRGVPPDRPRRPRGPRPPRPAAAGAARVAGARRLDQPRWPQPRRRAAHRPAGRGLRRRHVLRDVQHGAARPNGRARLRRPRVPDRGRPAGLRRAGGEPGSGRRPPTATRPGSAAPVWGCASGRRPRWCRPRAPGTKDMAYGHVGVASGGAPRGRHARRHGVHAADRSAGAVRPRRRGTRPAARACACCGAWASSIRPRSTTTGRTAATRRCGARSRSAPRPRSRRSPRRSSWAAAARRSPRA